MTQYIRVENISCDGCGLYDKAEKFPDNVNTPGLYLETMRKFGCEDDAIRNIGIGTVCPSCGNHYEFDFDPDDNMLERLVEEPEPEQLNSPTLFNHILYYFLFQPNG
jgi:hypothetical protein